MKHLISSLLMILLTFEGFTDGKRKEIFLPESVRLFLLPLNTAKSDFSPSVIDDSLFFTSQNDGLNKKVKRKNVKEGFCDLYSFKIDEEGNILGQRNVIKEFSAKYHNGPVSFCKTTGELFLTQSNYLESSAVYNPLRKNYYNLRILVAKKENGSWKTKESFPFNNPAWSVGHPAISPSGDSLVFASNKPGGMGETDLYLSVRKNGVWMDPVSLGSKINSPDKDEFPFITEHGELIFASSGRNGLGGLDIYYTKLNDPAAEVKHFIAPINSQYDDFSMVILPGTEYGYLTSDRPGKGQDDIYRFTFEKYKQNYLELLVLDSKSGKPVQDANVVINSNDNLKTGLQGEVIRMIEDDMSLAVDVTAFGYKNNNKLIQAGTLISGETIKDTILIDKLEVAKEKEKIVLRNIYYDYDSAELLEESIAELNKLLIYMIQNPTIQVTLSSHTDSRGSSLYNQKLSQRRLWSVVDYLIVKGIDMDRIVAKAYGKTVPVNNCVSLKSCSPEELRMNRRTEFYVPELGKSESVQQTGKGDYTTGSKAGKTVGSTPKNGKPSAVAGSFKDKKIVR